MTYSASNILPPTSLRDVISLILIINSLPSYINALILILYTLSGSTKLISGKLFLKYVSLKNKQFEDSWYLNSKINYGKVIHSFIQLSVIGSIILFLFIGIFNEDFLKNIDILAKTILATELIGSSTNITSIITSNNNNTPKINNEILNNNFLRIIYCYLIILFITSFKNNFNFNLFLNLIKVHDFKTIFSSKILLAQCLDKQKTPTSYFNKSILKFIYYELCINVVTIKFNSLFSIIGFKNLSNNLDQLNNLNPNIPIDFKRPKLKEEIDHELSIPVISLKQTNNSTSTINLNKTATLNSNKLKFINISVPESIAKSKCNFKSSNSISSKNFENFVYKLFSKNTNETTSPIKLNKNSTVIIDKNDSILQPFWSLLAVMKVSVKNSYLFQGKLTKVKNNNDKFLINLSIVNKLLISVKFIDDTRILLKINETNKNFSNLKIRLNGIDWEYFKIVDNQILIFALSPNFQYEIEILNNKNQILNNLLINTVSTTENIILRESPKISSLSTLKLSLISTLESLEQTKQNLKEFKKDESKRQGEIKKNNDNLKDRINKNKATNELNLKKLKGLSQSIHQYENDIKTLKTEIEEFKVQIKDQELSEKNLINEINDIRRFIDAYNESIVEFKINLKSIQDDKASFLNKFDKTLSKIKESENDIENLNDNINNLKDSIIIQLKKKSNSINDKFDTILLKVKNENERLLNEIEKLMK
ncbi:hypothetical protein CLIB1444_01S02894 [[Candida] jaroonii]|uniref:Uncharacterized protein n=1 Tax=[Candida] jaroonii TaxID=467808 RepID=A0ACA9Y057_9ASCO|nr:hypothetical protein CLIB1444_01S02894 [[Candida] jaroonii]